MNDIEVAAIRPGGLWLPPNKCSRSPVWAFVDYRTPDGIEGRLIYDSGCDQLWRYITSGSDYYQPWFARHMSALLPEGTVCELHDKFRRWNTADFVVGVDERLRWRH
jgi:hypothetical protein